MDKETQRKLDLLAALQAGGVENWEGYDLATKEHRKAIAREKKLFNIVDALLWEISKYIDKDNWENLVYEGRGEFGRVLLSRANELKELCDDHL